MVPILGRASSYEKTYYEEFAKDPFVNNGVYLKSRA